MGKTDDETNEKMVCLRGFPPEALPVLFAIFSSCEYLKLLLMFGDLRYFKCKLHITFM